MGMLGDMIVRIKADTGEFVNSLQKSERHMKKFVNFIAGGAGMGAAILIFRKFGNVVNDLVKEYAKTENANKELLGSINRLSEGMIGLKRQGGAAILEFLGPVITKMETLVTRTLQAWTAQRNLNKALKGEASTVAEVDAAIKEQNRQLEEANQKRTAAILLLDLYNRAQRGDAQAARRIMELYGLNYQLMAAKISQAKEDVAVTDKKIATGKENIKTLRAEREEIEKSNTVKAADVILTKEQIKAAEDKAEAIRIARVQATANEIADKKKLWDEEVEARQLVENELYELGQQRREQDLQAEEQHAADLNRIRRGVFDAAVALLSALSRINSNYYETLLQDETLTDEERKKLQYAQAKSAKEFAIFEAIITGAQAILNGLATQPFVPVGIAMGALAAILAGVQIAAVASEPLPKLARGGRLTRPTLVEAGEAGPEWFLPEARLGELGNKITDAMQRAQITNVLQDDRPIQLGVYLDGRQIDAHIQRSISDRRIIVAKESVA